MYIDELLSSLSRSDYGCHIGCNFVGASPYADDVVLLAQTPSAMRKLLIVRVNFASNFNVTFNSLKSKSLIVKPLNFVTDVKCTFTLNNAVINNVSDFLHLGHSISANIVSIDNADIALKCSVFIRQVNNLLSFFQPFTVFY